MTTPRYEKGTPYCLECNGALTKVLDRYDTVYRCDRCKREYIAPIEVQMNEAGVKRLI